MTPHPLPSSCGSSAFSAVDASNKEVDRERSIRSPRDRIRQNEREGRQEEQARRTADETESSKRSAGSSYRRNSSISISSKPEDDDMEATASSSPSTSSLLDMDLHDNVAALLCRCDHSLDVTNDVRQLNLSARHANVAALRTALSRTPSQLEVAKKLASNPPPPPPPQKRQSGQNKQNETIARPPQNVMSHQSFTTNLTEAAKAALGRARSRKHITRGSDLALPQLSKAAAAQLDPVEDDCSPLEGLTRDIVVGSKSSDSDILSSFSSPSSVLDEQLGSIADRVREQKIHLKRNRRAARAITASAETERDIRELQRRLLVASSNSTSQAQTTASTLPSGRTSAPTIPTHDGPRRMLTLRSFSRSFSVSDSSATMANRSRSPSTLAGEIDGEEEATSSVVTPSDISNTETFLSELEEGTRNSLNPAKTSLRTRLQRRIRRNQREKDENLSQSGRDHSLRRTAEEIERMRSSSTVEFSDDGRRNNTSRTPGSQLKSTLANRLFSFSDEENDRSHSSVANILLDLRRTAMSSTIGCNNDLEDMNETRGRTNTVISDGAVEAKLPRLTVMPRQAANVTLKSAATRSIFDAPSEDGGPSGPRSERKKKLKLSPRRRRKSAARRRKSLTDRATDSVVPPSLAKESEKSLEEKDSNHNVAKNDLQSQPPQQAIEQQIPRQVRKSAAPRPPNAQRTNQVQIHVYDLIASETYVEVLPWAGCEFPLGRCFSAMNTTLHALGTGAYHVGVEVNGIEYAFGANNIKGLSGVFTCHPKKSPGYGYRTSLDFGHRRTLRRTWISVPKVESSPTNNTQASNRKDTDNSEKSTDSSSDESAGVDNKEGEGVRSRPHADSLKPSIERKDRQLNERNSDPSETPSNVTTVYRETENFVDGRTIMREMAVEYMGVDYDLLKKNCCTFAYDACLRLGVAEHEIPTWFLNIAEAGAATEAAVARVETSVLSPIKNIISSHAVGDAKPTFVLGSEVQKPQPQTGYEVIAKSTTKKGNVRRTELEIVHVVERFGGRAATKTKKKVPRNGSARAAKENEQASGIRETLSF